MQQNSFDATKIKLVIGLGNPGSAYVGTRHNAGFLFVDRFMLEVSNRNSAVIKTELSERCEIFRLKFDAADGFGEEILLVKPMVGMNNSGIILKKFVRDGLEPAEILVVHDDIEKRFATVGLKFGGSARGHNGVRSIISVIGKDFWRMRIGIGRPEEKIAVADYVLSRFSHEESEKIIVAVDEAVAIFLGSVSKEEK